MSKTRLGIERAISVRIPPELYPEVKALIARHAVELAKIKAEKLQAEAIKARESMPELFDGVREAA